MLSCLAQQTSLNLQKIFSWQNKTREYSQLIPNLNDYVLSILGHLQSVDWTTGLD